ncbi:Rri2 [Kluyveromyces lactis]|nr:Rri2 [Kluyveromyces lactis]
MSDEEDYAEYMMSEEDMSSFEMDVDSDVEPDDAGLEQDQQVTDDDYDGSAGNSSDSVAAVEKQCESWYDTGKAFKNDDQFEEARKWFMKCHASPMWWFKSLKQIIKSDFSQGLRVDERLREMFELVSTKKEMIGEESYIYGSVKRLINRIVPDLNSHLLFTERLRQSSIDVSTLMERQSYLDILEKSVADMDQELRDLVTIRKIVYCVWIHVLRWEQIPKETLEELHENINLETYFILLQLHVRTFVDEDIVHLIELVKVVDEMGRFMTNSLSVSQIPTVTSVYHFAKFLTLWKSTDHYNQSQMLSKCEGELTSCFQDLEAIGGSERDGLMLTRLSLMGIVFCHLLLNDKTKLVPFELEQIKVLEADELVVLLQELYQCWLDMDIYALEQCLLQLEDFYSPWYNVMIEKIIALCQSNKLWKRIAPTYSCIALQDLMAKLETGNTITMNRDQLLTLLMKSIAKDTADVYYKLDLVEDYVYFGEEYFVPLRSEELNIVNPLSQQMGSEIIGKDEWLCNVSNWHKQKVPKKLSAIEFMDYMKAARVTISQTNLAHQEPTVTSFLLKLSTITHAQVTQNSSSLASTN